MCIPGILLVPLPQAPRARPGEGGSTIDFSTLFADLDSDLDSSDGSDEDEDGQDGDHGDDLTGGRESVTGRSSAGYVVFGEIAQHWGWWQRGACGLLVAVS